MSRLAHHRAVAAAASAADRTAFGLVQTRHIVPPALLCAAVMLSLVLTPATPASAQTGAPVVDTKVSADARYDAARDQYEIGHFQLAFAEFAALADGGHCEAARMALQMLRHGKSLYATEFHAPLERAQQWQRLPACGAKTAQR